MGSPSLLPSDPATIKFLYFSMDFPSLEISQKCGHTTGVVESFTRLMSSHVAAQIRAYDLWLVHHTSALLSVAVIVHDQKQLRGKPGLLD